MADKGTLIIISGPSGSGKGTIVRELVSDERFVLSISVTTRKPRDGEQEGVHYFYRSKEEFEQMIANNELLEWAEFVGNYYGTPREFVETQLALGKDVILEIEVLGALQVKKAFPDSALVFVVPPTLKELRSRLRIRGSEDDPEIEERIRRAKEEVLQIDKYDYFVVNDSIFKAVKDIINIVKAEPLRVSRCKDIISQFKGEIFNA